MSINVTLLDTEPKPEVPEVPDVPIVPEVPEVKDVQETDNDILNLSELEEVDLTPPLSETSDLSEENKLLTTIVDISSSTEPQEEKEEDLDIPEFNLDEETINLDDLTVTNDDEEEEKDELEEDFSLDEVDLDDDVNDALFEDITEKPEFDFIPRAQPVFVFTPRTEPEVEVESSDIEVESCPNFVALLDDKEDTPIKSGGAKNKYNKIQSLDYLETENYLKYLDSYEQFLKEKNIKGNLSKFTFEEFDEKLVKTSLKTGKKTTIVLPKYRRVDEILEFIHVQINEIIYRLKKKRDDIEGNNSDNFNELKEEYLKLIHSKKVCLKFISNNKNKDNEINLKKKIEMKRNLFILNEKIKRINLTTNNKEERESLIREYIEENKLLSLEKKIRENNNSNFLWNDPDTKSVSLKYDKTLKYDKILVNEPNVKKEGEPVKKKLIKKIKKKEEKKGAEKEEKKGAEKGEKKGAEKEEKKGAEKGEKPKKKLKIKFNPSVNDTDPSAGDEDWDGPYKDTSLSSGKGKQQIKTEEKLTSLEKAKEECNKLDECKGITSDSSKGKIKISLRTSDKLKKSEEQKSWLKK